jgi:hypothetical protein
LTAQLVSGLVRHAPPPPLLLLLLLLPPAATVVGLVISYVTTSRLTPPS